MKNASVLQILNDCDTELKNIEVVLNNFFGNSSPAGPYLIKYSIIRACGAIEVSFKTLIYDVITQGQSLKIQKYFEDNLKESSMNPSFDNICKVLRSFDKDWNDNFKNNLKKLVANESKVKSSLSSLNNARNSFAHGGATSLSIHNVIDYYKDSIEILEVLELTIA